MAGERQGRVDFTQLLSEDVLRLIVAKLSLYDVFSVRGVNRWLCCTAQNSSA